MNWKPITDKTVFPKDRTFILYDEKTTSGLCIYEAMAFDDGSLGCPATFKMYDPYNPKDFSHWSELPKLPKRKRCQPCKRGR